MRNGYTLLEKWIYLTWVSVRGRDIDTPQPVLETETHLAFVTEISVGKNIGIPQGYILGPLLEMEMMK